MLELTEMEVIHKLEDDMQDMLSIEDEEAAPASFLSLATGTGKATGKATATERTKPEKSPKASSNGFGFAAMEALHEDHDEDEFLFYDDDDDDDDDDDEEVLPVRVVEEERNAGESSDEKVNFLFYDVADDDEDEEVVVHVKEERNDDNVLDAVNTDTTNTAADQRPHTLTTRTTTTLHKKNDDSASTSASDQAPKHIREDEKSKKKFKKNIFKKIGMKKSISMGMFSKHWNNDVEVRSSLDVSVHRRTETLSLEFDDDEHEHENEHEHEHEHEYMEKVKFSLDDSSHGRQIDLGTGTSRGGTNMNTRTRSIPRTDLVSSSAIPTTSKSPSFSPNSIADMMTSPEEPPPLPPPLMRTPATLTKISNADNATADSADDSLSAFKHCPKKKPAQSILRKATSMLNLSSLATNPSASISTSAHASSAPLTPAFASNNAAINNRKQMKRTTSFSTLEIREYNITIGDNPGGKAGPPISLDWNYSERNTVRMCIDKYEKTRPPRRARHEMYMPGKIRMWTLLKELGYTLRDIDSASKAADSIRKKRQKSIKYKGIHDLQYKVGKIMSRGGRGAGVA
jgi:hypothetical protein